MAPKRNVSLGEVTQTSAAKTLQRLPDIKTTDKGCRVTGKKSGHANGYVKAKPADLNATNEFYLHHLALVAADRRDELALVRQGGDFECSHICHNTGCFNAEHLVVETSSTNKQRNFCVTLDGSCCGTKVTNCRHGAAVSDVDRALLYAFREDPFLFFLSKLISSSCYGRLLQLVCVFFFRLDGLYLKPKIGPLPLSLWTFLSFFFLFFLFFLLKKFYV